MPQMCTNCSLQAVAAFSGRHACANKAVLCCSFVDRFNKLLDHACSSDKPLQVHFCFLAFTLSLRDLVEKSTSQTCNFCTSNPAIAVTY